jgi:hypothetical protein
VTILNFILLKNCDFSQIHAQKWIKKWQKLRKMVIVASTPLGRGV